MERDVVVRRAGVGAGDVISRRGPPAGALTGLVAKGSGGATLEVPHSWGGGR